MVVGTLIGLLLPFCCVLAMGSMPSGPPPLMPAHAGLRVVVAGTGGQTSSVWPARSARRKNSIRSLPPFPRELTLRRNVRDQTPHRVRRAKKACRAAGPTLRRTFSSSTKPPERAALSLLSMRRGRSPPSA